MSSSATITKRVCMKAPRGSSAACLANELVSRQEGPSLPRLGPPPPTPRIATLRFR